VHVPCGRKFLEAAGLIDADGVGFAIEICDDDIRQLVVVEVGDENIDPAFTASPVMHRSISPSLSMSPVAIPPGIPVKVSCELMLTS
jgi:hypothetical protein